jgi:RHS repeat-associated protein
VTEQDIAGRAAGNGGTPAPRAMGAGLSATKPSQASPARPTARAGSEAPSGTGQRADRQVAQSPGQPASAQTASPSGAADLLPTVALPKGGGAIRSMDEKFEVTSATGTGSMSIKLPLSPGRSGFTPQIHLSYDSGSGNGPLGFGWALGVPAITRKTDKGLPQYCDGDESDVYLLAGAEDLVPLLDPAGGRQSIQRTVYGTEFQVASYRPRIEGLFSRIERWTAIQTGLIHWRTISRDNVTALYGYDPGSTVANPADPAQIFSWQVCRSWDDQGNVATYRYRAEDSNGIDQSAAHEANRTLATRQCQIYLDTVTYGNLQPYRPDWTAEKEVPLPADWMFSIVLDYGDHSSVPPTPASDQPWPLRPDPFSSYRSGFEVRSYRRVQRILFFNNFPDEPTAGQDCLVRSLDLSYSDQQNPPDPHGPIYTFLISVTQTGYRQSGQGPVTRSMPPLEFTYSEPVVGQDILTLDPDSLDNLPEGIDDSRFRWVDLDGEGLSGILADAGGGWYYKRNTSADNRVAQPDQTLATRARFGPLETLAALPSRSDLAGVRLLDLSGSGRLSVVSLADPDPGFFERTEDGAFEPLQRFDALPVLDYADPNVRFLDVTGDGLADIIMTEDGLFTIHRSLGGAAGFDTARLVRPGWDEERGPSVVLADGTQTIFTADVSGDGLSDIVRVRNGEACYWPNLGYGRFGAKVTMDQAPRFDNEERFDPRRIRLADIDGSGTADIVYIGENGVTAWFNQSGNAWSAPTQLAVFPSADQLSTVQVIDLLGTGTACLVWSSPLPAETRAPLCYVDLMSGIKPHLMTSARNNLGAETRVTYAPSTRFYVADESAGTPWVTRLPFPVQVVERIEFIDWIGRNRLVTRYAYHHGYFDGYEREFRGFGMVEQCDTEELRSDTGFSDGDFVNWAAQSWSPPMRTRTWFHTGAFIEALAVTRQYQGEYWSGDPAAVRPPDTVLPAGLNAFEIQEGYRALKGHPLRIETYADDTALVAANPYTVTEQNFSLTCLQTMGENLHAVFLVEPREAISYHYERDPSDPRIGHEITLQTDAYGNILRSVSIGYPRRTGYEPPEPGLSAGYQEMLAYDQGRLHFIGAERTYTNPIDDLNAWPDAYRAPQLAASDTAEITGAQAPGPSGVYTFEDVDAPDINGQPGVWPAVWTGNSDVPYEQIPGSDVDGSGSPAAEPTRRFIAQQRTFYRSDDLTAVLAAGALEPMALPGESYRAALTPGLVTAIYGALVTAAVLGEGGYAQLAEETGWWIPSGRVYYSPGDTDTPAQELAVAQAQFFMPRRAVDPFGGISRADYDGYQLLAAVVTDPVNNKISAANDYRVLMPATVTDPNGNRVSAAFDVLGYPTATAVMGKTPQALGDLLAGFDVDLDEATLLAQFADPLGDPAAILGSATTRSLYDVGAYQRTAASPQPSAPAAYTLARETHVSDLAAAPYPGAPQTTRYQYHFVYSDGFGREVQRKAQVAPGSLTDQGPMVTPRWAGSGWTIFDNKGRPVKRFEPFFSATNGFEFAAINGVCTTVCYDPPGRVVATLHPDQTWEKVVFGPWQSQSWDGDDTVLIEDPRTDPDVGGYFKRILPTGPFASWYQANSAGSAAQQDAAQKASTAAATPSAAHSDALGRACLAVADNGGASRLPSRTAFDTQGKPLAVFDQLGRRAEEYCYRAPQAGGGFTYLAGADMAGQPLYHVNADAGARRSVPDIAGQPIRSWDARGHAFRLAYDAARRPIQRFASTGGAPEVLIDLTVYGEGQPGANLCGHVFRHYDMAGYVENSQYDYKGNLLSSFRQLGVSYRQASDWTPLAGLTAAPDLDAAAINAGLVPSGDGGRDKFAGSVAYDALNRPVQQVSSHNATMQPDVIQPGYDEAALLTTIDVWLQHAEAPAALLDPATADRHAVTSIEYNQRGQRLSVANGNGTTSAYEYDDSTFRLTNLTTARPGTFAASQQTVQDLAYCYDAVGNVTSIADTADTQNVIFFNNQRVDPSASYAYDPIYRLTTATGREHLGQTGGGLSAPKQVANDDSFRMGPPLPGEGNAMGTYTESYIYDAVGNITTMGHVVASGSWTRRYTYTEASQVVATETGNRLSTTSIPGDPAAGPFNGKYSHDADGNMTTMPHLAALTWDEDDRLRSTIRAPAGAGTPQTAYYVYAPDAQRIRKLTDAPAAAGQAAVRKAERIYLGGIEIYREYAADGTTITLERETLHVSDGDQPVAVVETRTTGDDKAPAQLVRYQLGNHLGSSVLELDDNSSIISYEEYFPFGSTSYQAVPSQVELPKRYRFTGKERDEESDLYYHGARYYGPWLGRWTSCDPLGQADGANLYGYVHGNPIKYVDLKGTQGTPILSPSGQPLPLVWLDPDQPAGPRGLPEASLSGPSGPRPGAASPAKPQLAHKPGAGEAKHAIQAPADKASVQAANEPANGGHGQPAGKPSPKGDPTVSDPEALRQAEGMGRFELGDIVQFGKGLWNGPASWVGAATIPTDPHYAGAAEVGKELGKNLAIEILSAGIGKALEVGLSYLRGATSTGRATGAFASGASGGSGLGIFSERQIRVSQKGLQLVERHLARFGHWPENEAMLGRLRAALAGGRSISGADAIFYTHEASEATKMAKLIQQGASADEAYEIAHEAALQKYDVSKFSVYHADVIHDLAERFNSNWKAFWKIK